MKDNFKNLLDNDYITFDQTPGAGWRGLVGQYSPLDIAEVILAYCEKSYKQLSDHQMCILKWHAGQNFAGGGNYQKAIDCMMESYQESSRARKIGWNDYVSATIGFLRKDKGEVLAAYELLKKAPEYTCNVDIVGRMISNFEASYEEVYG